jgi:rubrerythrin
MKNSDLAVGDRVLKLSAYPHPIPTLKRTAVGCPKCGHAAEERGAKRCPWCREPLAKWK